MAPSNGKLSLTKNGKKRRRPKLAPRYTDAASDAHVLDPRSIAMNAENEPLLHDVFTTSTCRCFILKSFSDANLHKSLKYGIWSSTYAHNMQLDQIFKSDLSSVRPVLFFFSVCDTRHFSGIARMTSSVRTDAKFALWEKPKYEGVFHVEWLLVKDVPNHALTGIKMSNTPSKKSITSCRDCEEVLYDEASEFISIFTKFPHRTSAWDDYNHFDRLQTQLEAKRSLRASDPTDVSTYLTPIEPV
uniref:YTH domain-containing protein n=1 Tax=Globisporangium ultimum (strain ATCC 200006 / CBS 805.95 / DAOM BR144) TaxID=431595 RepID=K3WL53_GLOUD